MSWHVDTPAALELILRVNGMVEGRCAKQRKRRLDGMKQMVQIPYELEQDEDDT